MKGLAFVQTAMGKGEVDLPGGQKALFIRISIRVENVIQQSAWLPYPLVELWLRGMESLGYEVQRTKKYEQYLKEHPVASDV